MRWRRLPGVRDRVSFEGQAAMDLEWAAEAAGYGLKTTDEGCILLRRFRSGTRC